MGKIHAHIIGIKNEKILFLCIQANFLSYKKQTKKTRNKSHR